MKLLDAVRIVLIGTTHPGNIGSAARAMKTMGVQDLQLVAPERFPAPEATANAAHAADVLEAAGVHEELDQALAGAGLVVGLTARSRRLGAPSLEARPCAERLMREATRHPVALLFGREHSGLSNAELDRCHYVVHIPANPDYPVMNLAAAVQVMCYELRMAAMTGEAPTPEALPEVAGAEHLEGFYRHLEQLLEDTGYLRRFSPEVLMRRLRHLFNRARPSSEELNILRGMLSAMERHKRGRD
ncbi:RNA methyltransferase [Alkalilimnicola sp. S0819]|uniref:RNA methyltransferase n=1 Tax=Alkalilimnicola sp. S0819 TaxID=2613922 RepID=UPI00126140E1|nr:RNA methyltransferase [Alkalilimnicola sp. S0819]KAB7628394.1 RNA methyltransferase [Alkalilimnicola sp. S0819]MPQ15297.1 TrmJ/YjtD family RNA methyltransferase [Alkalilimnicola sp. S0819]